MLADWKRRWTASEHGVTRRSALMALSGGVGISHGDNNLQGFEVVKRCLHWLR